MRVKLLLLGLLLLGLGVQGNSLGASSLSASTNDSCPPPKPRQIHQVEQLQIAFIDCKSSDEVVIILNGSNEDLNLTDYNIVTPGERPFVFKQTIWNQGCCFIKAHDVFRIHSGEKNTGFFNDLRDLHWLLSEVPEPRVKEVWNNDADIAVLCNDKREVLDTYLYGNSQDMVTCME